MRTLAAMLAVSGLLAACSAEAPSDHAPAVLSPTVAAMSLAPSAPPKAAAKPLDPIDIPFEPPAIDGTPAEEGKKPVAQPDQLPVPGTIGELVRSKPCTTALSLRLSAQLAAQMNCIKPNTFSYIGDIPNVRLGPAANPFIQSKAAKALREVAAAHPDAIFAINSSWRSVVQQHILKKWEGTCGISIAANPGTSHHESGLAIDVPREVTQKFRKSLRRAGFVWYCDEHHRGRQKGCRDIPHHTFKGGGKDVRTLSVRAYQMLWNKAHPEDPLPVIGVYGPKTSARIDRTPTSGFETGTTCSAPVTHFGNGPTPLTTSDKPAIDAAEATP